MEYLSTKTWIPYPSKYGNPIHEKTEENITSINNKEKEEERNFQEELKKTINFYEENITLISPFVAEDMEKYLEEGLEAELIIEAMKEAVSRNARNWSYVVSILNDCCNNKIKTAKQFRIKQEEFKSNKIHKNETKTAKEKVEYEEVEYTEEEYRERLYEKQKGGNDV